MSNRMKKTIQLLIFSKEIPIPLNKENKEILIQDTNIINNNNQQLTQITIQPE